MQFVHSWRLLALTVALVPSAVGVSQTPGEDLGQIEVRISSKSNVVMAGETLEVRVEISNVGRKQVFIEKRIYQECSYSPLSLQLELGPPLQPGPGVGCASDCGDNPKASFTNRVVQRWIPLPVGHFYGTTVRMYPDLFPQLRTPGRWRLRGEYRSDGDMSLSICFFGIPLDPEQTAKLPYKAWKGKVDTNEVWIEVVEPSKPDKEKQQK